MTTLQPHALTPDRVLICCQFFDAGSHHDMTWNDDARSRGIASSGQSRTDSVRWWRFLSLSLSLCVCVCSPSGGVGRCGTGKHCVYMLSYMTLLHIECHMTASSSRYCVNIRKSLA